MDNKDKKEALAQLMNEMIARNVDYAKQDLLKNNSELYNLLESDGLRLSESQKELLDTFAINIMKQSTAASSLVALELIEKACK